VIIALFLVLPVSPLTVYLFAAGIGFLWLGTVPAHQRLVAQILRCTFLCRCCSASSSSAIRSAVSPACGWRLPVRSTGSYDLVWIGSIALGVIAAILNLPIDERPVVRVERAPRDRSGLARCILVDRAGPRLPRAGHVRAAGLSVSSAMIDFANMKLCALAAPCAFAE